MKRWLPLLLCLGHFVVLVAMARQHPYGTYATETDFYHLYAPDAERIAAGQFPQNTFQGPGYPAAIALLAKLTGKSDDLFAVGKWTSIVCAVVCGGLIFLLFSRLFGGWAGLGAQLLAIASGEFPQYSIQAGTDVFFLMLCLATLAVFLWERWPARARVVCAGLLAGGAYVVRYNGLFLVAACLVGILLLDLFGQAWRERGIASAWFLGAFLLAASPWLAANARHNGSPLYNTNYLNLATEFYPELVGGKVNQDATRPLEQRFHSFGDVVRYDPKRMLAHYPENLWESLRLSVTDTLTASALAWLGWLGILFALGERRSKPALFLLCAGGFYVLLMGLNHWETRYYFFLMALYAGFAVRAAWHWLTLARRQGWLAARGFDAVPVAIVGVLLVLVVAQSRGLAREFLDSHPAEIPAARAYLEREKIHGKRILARKPHLAYLTRNEWVFFPQFKTIEELRAWLDQNPVDYIAVGKRELKQRKGLAALGDPKKAPKWLTAVWTLEEPNFILYRPAADTRDRTLP